MVRHISRRDLLRASAAAAGLVVADPLLPKSAWAAPKRRTATLAPTGADAPFEHVVVVMMENRSFDHFLGWLPGADGVQDGLTYTDTSGVTYPTFHLGGDYQGCDGDDPDHSYEGGLTQLHEGFLATATPGDQLPLGYYNKEDIGFRADLATNFTVLDNYFASIMAETYPNRFYQHAARTDRLHNNGVTQVADPDALPTIWDRINASGGDVTGRYYATNLPFIGLWGTKYAPLIGTFPEFLATAAAGQLPNVSFVDPDFAGEELNSGSNDDHPRGDIRGGAWFLQQVYTALRSNEAAWAKTVLVINYDEWGGFYDHVTPPKVVDDSTNATLTVGGPPSPSDKYEFSFNQLGFRVPCIVASPFAPAQVWNEGPYEHTSVLKMIEWRWGLEPLTARDANARNLAEVLDFSANNTALAVGSYDPNPAQAQPCGPQSAHYTHPEAVPSPELPEVPLPAVLPVAAAVAGGAAMAVRAKRKKSEPEVSGAEA
jgi:phospholipase C